MSDVSEGNSSLQQALTGGALQLIGAYRFYFDQERWEWSEEVQRLHGYEPGAVTPTTELVLSHKHPEDYAKVAATLEDVRRTNHSAPATASSPSRATPATSSSWANDSTTTTAT